MTASGAVVDRGGHVGGLGSRRYRRRDHRFEHLGRHDHRLARVAASPHDAPRDARHVFGRKLHSEVAARDHDRVGQLDHLVVRQSSAAGFSIFRHQSGPPADDVAEHDEVAWPLDERRRHPVGSELEPEGEVLPVLVGQRGDGQNRVGNVHSLVVGNRAADPYARAGEVRARTSRPAAGPCRRRRRRFVPGLTAAKTSGWGSATRFGLPGDGSRSSVNDAPAASMMLPSANRPIRSFGPCRSTTTPIGRPVEDSSARIASYVRRCASWSPWLKFRRNTSTPARYRLRIESGPEVAGPSVAMIFANRCLLTRCLRSSNRHLPCVVRALVPDSTMRPRGLPCRMRPLPRPRVARHAPDSTPRRRETRHVKGRRSAPGWLES